MSLSLLAAYCAGLHKLSSWCDTTQSPGQCLGVHQGIFTKELREVFSFSCEDASILFLAG